MVSVIVIVDIRKKEIIEKLQAAGLQITNVMALVGVIAGQIEKDKIPELSKIEGVLRVSDEPEIQL